MSQELHQHLVTLVFKYGQYWLFHAKSLLDDAFKNHADRVWRIVKHEKHANQKRANTFKVGETDVIKFGRVRFRVKKLLVDPSDIRALDKEPASSSRGGPSGGGMIPTLEDNSIPPPNISEGLDARSLGRGETLAGFDNRPFEFEDALMKQKEQENRIKNTMFHRQ